MIAIAEEYKVVLGTSAACTALAVSRATLYRHRRPIPRVHKARRVPRALSKVERETVLATLNAPENIDKSPWTVVAQLLSSGAYLCHPLHHAVPKASCSV